MATDTEVKLLTLLNVAAIKRPRDLDIPGGQRGSPSIQSGSRGASPAIVPTASKSPKSKASPAVDGKKKRKGVVFGGEIGPSGSGFGKKVKVAEGGKGKGKGKEVNGNGDSNSNGHASNGNGNGHEQEDGGVEVEEGSDDEGPAASGTFLTIVTSARRQAHHQLTALTSTSVWLPTYSSQRQSPRWMVMIGRRNE
jgi:U3 small nucleolar RNA-associated protein 25